MTKAIPDIPKKRGRPKQGGRGQLIALRLHPPQLAKLDAWINREAPGISRPEAIRRLIEERLKPR